MSTVLESENVEIPISTARSLRIKAAWQTAKLNAYQVNAGALSFGVEIECYMPREKLTVLGVNVGGYHSGTVVPSTLDPLNLWKCERDGSLNSEQYNADGSTSVGVEFVSPTLYGLAGFKEVERFVKLLEKNGATVTRQCGLHVSVGLASIVQANGGCHSGGAVRQSQDVRNFLRRLMHFVSIHENGMMQIGGRRSRVNNRYCRTSKIWANSIRKDMPLSDFWHLIHQHGRYSTVNLMNCGDTGKERIEFRVFGGTVNPVKVLGYIAVALGICHKSAEAAIAPKVVLDNYSLPSVINDRKAVLRLHVALWTRHAEVKFGLPEGVWEKWGKRFLKIQRWNGRQFIAGAPTDNTSAGD